MYNKSFEGEKEMTLEELRNKHGLTQRKLFEITGIPVRTIQNWEGGKSNCPPYILGLVKFRLEHMEKGK